MQTDFTLYGAEHLFWLGLAAVSTFLILRAGLYGDEERREKIAQYLAWITPLVFILPTLYIAPTSDWDLNLIIPLHL